MKFEISEKTNGILESDTGGFAGAAEARLSDDNVGGGVNSTSAVLTKMA